MPVYDPEKHDSHVSPDPGRNPGEQHEKGLESKFDSRALSNRELRNSEESKNAGWYSAFKNGDNGHSAKDTDEGDCLSRNCIEAFATIARPMRDPIKSSTSCVMVVMPKLYLRARLARLKRKFAESSYFISCQASSTTSIRRFWSDLVLFQM